MIDSLNALSDYDASGRAHLEAVLAPCTNTGMSPAIYMTSTYQHDHEGTYAYGRQMNPNFTLLQEQLRLLHGGERAVVYASGMAAIAATCFAVNPRHLVVPRELYTTARKFTREYAERVGAQLSVVDSHDIHGTVAALLAHPGPRLLYLECVSNPSTTCIPDLPALSARVRAEVPDCTIVMDNTWLSPALFRPFPHVDLVIESCTKYIDGRGEVLLGAVIAGGHHLPAGRIDPALRHWRSLLGGVPSPFSCWLVSQAVQTLELRMREVSANALAVAQALEAHLPVVSRVYYPGLQSHPRHDVAKRLFEARGAGVVFFHLPVPDPRASLPERLKFVDAVLRDADGIAAATSYGEVHPLAELNSPGDALSNLYEPHLPDPVEGYWLRLYVGLVPPADVVHGLLGSLARHYAVPLPGKVHNFYVRPGVVELVAPVGSTFPPIRAGDVLVQDRGGAWRYFDVLEDSRRRDAGEQTLRTVKVQSQGRIAKGVALRVLHRHPRPATPGTAPP